MVAIIILLIYDFIFLFLTMRTPFDILLLGYDYFWSEFLTILYVLMLWAMNRDLLKAHNPIKYKESTDWFYEKYEGKEKK